MGIKTNLAVLGLGAVAVFVLFKNASGIGNFLGTGLREFGNNIIGGIGQIGSGISGGFTNTSEEEIIGTNRLEDQTTNVPQGGGFGEITPTNRGLLTFAQTLKDRNFAGKIDFEDKSFVNDFTRQKLDFTINQQSGRINTGRVGLSDAVLRRQNELSTKFGIPTFDTRGNLSSFAGQTVGITERISRDVR